MKPIIFSTEMVKAILDGKKTQTRRVIKSQPNEKEYLGYDFHSKKCYFGENKCIHDIIKTKYQVGDVLWVRETWMPCATIDSYLTNTNLYAYKANYTNDEAMIALKKQGAKWRSSMYMPREAARLFLRVTGVRVERIQDISEADTITEGIEKSENGPLFWHYLDSKLHAWMNFETHKEAFAYLWDSIHVVKRGYGWDFNPWVWIYEFERVEI